MPYRLSTWRYIANQIDRIWLPFIVLTSASTEVGILAGLWSRETGASVMRFLIFYFCYRIIHYLRRLIAQSDTAFASLKQMAEERVPSLQGTRVAAESIADVLELIREDNRIIRLELKKNTNVTQDSAAAAQIAAELAIKTATRQRESLASDLDTERTAAASGRENILRAVSEVHETAKASFKEANDVNKKIKDLNERLLHEEKKTPSGNGQMSSAEASLQRIDGHTAAIEHNTAATAKAIAKNSADIVDLQNKSDIAPTEVIPKPGDTTLSLAEASLQRIDEHTAAIDLKITAHINESEKSAE